MTEQNAGLEPFAKFVEAFDPWLGQAVLIGGWAHRLYWLDSRARKLPYLPIATLDGDVAVPAKLKVEESTVRERLIKAGFGWLKIKNPTYSQAEGRHGLMMRVK